LHAIGRLRVKSSGSRRRRARIPLLAFATLWMSAGIVWADSALMLPYPASFGKIPAATFDTGRHRVGDANLEIEELDDGSVQLYAESGVDGGARTIATATLAPIPGTHLLRPVLQQSQSFGADNEPLGVMTIDHNAGVAVCSHPGSDGEGMQVHQIALPSHDRVANVPLNLLFDPLVKGNVSEVDFQILLCKDSAKLVDFQARVVHREAGADPTDHLVEVRYGPDFGSVFSMLANVAVPRLSFWFDPASSSPWMAHRMPLYTDGPEVLVVRKGIETNTLIE